MATLLLGAAGRALGAAFLGPFGALIGGGIGALAGNVVDQTLFGGRGGQAAGSRLTSVDITASTEGSPIPVLWGRSRMGGALIWATRFEEEVQTVTEKTGGKGGFGTTATGTEYVYYANFAVAFCEGPVARIGRIWADGKEVDQDQVTIRTYHGTESQAPDALIEAKEGSDNTPAFRGLAYAVFDRLPINDYGRRIPQVTAEIFRAIGDVEYMIRGVCLIPGSTEFGYEPDTIQRNGSNEGEVEPENRHTLVGASDWSASIDQLEDLVQNVGSTVLAFAWFGDDLRAGVCTIRPKVETAGKSTSPARVDGRGPGARRRRSHQPGRRTPRLWRFARRHKRHPCHQGPQEPWALGCSLPAHHDGYPVRQQPAGPVFRRCRRGRPGNLSLARAHHRLAGGRLFGHRR